ncbi:hypothetical protein CV741_28540, partial [Bacillus cereus]
KGDDRIGNGVRRFQASHGFAKATASTSDIEWKVFDDYTVKDLISNGKYLMITPSKTYSTTWMNSTRSKI